MPNPTGGSGLARTVLCYDRRALPELTCRDGEFARTTFFAMPIDAGLRQRRCIVENRS
jgi:hypothetical protein